MSDKILQYSLSDAAPVVYYAYASKIQKYCEDNEISFNMKNTENNLKETLCKSRRHTISFCPLNFYIELLDFFEDVEAIEKKYGCSVRCNLSMGSHIGTFDKDNPHLYLSITFSFIINNKVVMKWKLIPHIDNGKKVINQGIVINNGGMSPISYRKIFDIALKRYKDNYDHVIIAPGTIFIHCLVTRLKFGYFDKTHPEYPRERKAIVEHIAQFNTKYNTNMYLSDDDDVLNLPHHLKNLCDESYKDGINYPYITSMVKNLSDYN